MLIIKGIIIGIGKIIPGVSGSMLAISMGIYQTIINSINNFFKDVKTNFFFLFQIGIGILVPVIFFSKIILECITNFYLITYFFFIGLILGSLKIINKSIVKEDKITYVVLIISTILSFISFDNTISFNNSIIQFMYFIMIGFIDAITTVIPGISGTAVLMTLGSYNTIISSLATLTNFSLLYQNILILFPFFIGLGFGIIITIKFINHLFNNYYIKAYSIIKGFSISTIVVMCIRCFNSIYNFQNLLFAFLFLFVGYIISKKVNHSFHD